MSSYGVAFTCSGVYSDRICSRPWSIAFHSSCVSTPHPSNARACARLARMSTSRRTASIPSDRFIFSKTGSLSSSNRPCHSFILFHHQPGPHGSRQPEEIDEALGVVMIVTAGVKGCDVLSIQAEWRYAALHSHRALVEAHRNGAGHDLLGFIEERVERLPQRIEPLSFIHHLRVGDAEDILVITSLLVENEGFEFAMGRRNQRSSGRFVDTPRLHSDDTILDTIGTAYPIGSGNFVQILKKLDGRNPVAVQSDRRALFEIDGDFAFSFGAGTRIQRQHE